MKKKTASIVCGILAAVFILAGCGKEAGQQQSIQAAGPQAEAMQETQTQQQIREEQIQEDQIQKQQVQEHEISDLEKQKLIIDDYAVYLLQEDADSLAYDEVLAVLEEYAENQDEEKLEAAKEELDELKQFFEDEYQKLEPVQLDQKLVRLLTEQRILTAEYEAFVKDRSILLAGFLDNLDYLGFYLEDSAIDETGLNDFTAALGRYQKIQEQQRQYYYTSINLWFAGWGQEAVKYAKEQVMDQCRSFYSDDFEWKDSADEVEKEMMIYLDHIEAVDGELAAEIGRKEEELLQMQKELEALKQE